MGTTGNRGAGTDVIGSVERRRVISVRRVFKDAVSAKLLEGRSITGSEGLGNLVDVVSKEAVVDETDVHNGVLTGVLTGDVVGDDTGDVRSENSQQPADSRGNSEQPMETISQSCLWIVRWLMRMIWMIWACTKC